MDNIKELYKQKGEKMYSNNKQLDEIIQEAIVQIESGNSTNNLTAMIKKTPTYILLANETHDETRYTPGNQLVTYNGINQDGKPIQETWGGGIAQITEDSVILRNADSIKYPEGHNLAGKEVKGNYNPDGTFVVNQKKGKTTLFNEYVSDTNFVKNAYGKNATTVWQEAFKLEPSYVIQIPKNLENVDIKTNSGIEINLAGGDYVVIDTKKGKISSVHGCEKTWLDKTYVGLEAYMKN